MMSMEIKSEANSGLITRDFLGGGCFGVESKELDLDLHVPSGWEKRLDLKSGKVFLQRCNPAYTANEQRNAANKMSPKHHDLNTSFLQSSSTYSIKQSTTLGLLEHPSLDLKLVSNNNSPTSYTSVCTLDKVKSALDRAERASPTTSSSSSSSKKRLLMMSTPSPSNNSSVSDERDPLTNQNAGLLVAAACPGCLLYVLISKNDPKCPKCSSVVNLPVLSKKPKIDLNISI